MYIIDFDNSSSEEIMYELFEEDAIHIINYLNQNDGEFYSDFEDNIYLDKLSKKKVYIKATHVTTSAEKCSDIKKYGLLNLQQAVTEKCELSSFLKSNGIIINVRDKKVLVNDHVIDLSPENNIHEQEWIYHKLYRDYFINGFINGEDILNYSVLRCYPEFIDKLDDRIKIDLGEELDLKGLWKRRANPYLVEFYFPIEQLNCEIYVGFKKYTPELTVNELALKRMRWLIKLLFSSFGYGERKLDRMIYLEGSYQVPTNLITNVKLAL